MAKEPENTVAELKVEDETVEMPVREQAESAEPEKQEVTLSKEEFLEVKARIDALQSERDEMKQLAQRVQADFDNFRRRNAGIHADSVDEGARNVVKALLPALDNFDRALDNTDGVDEGWLSGIKLVHKQLMDELKKLGLEEIPTDGGFDPMIHEAVMQEEKEGANSGDIVSVLQKGYKLKERIIRHSMVTVAK